MFSEWKNRKQQTKTSLDVQRERKMWPRILKQVNSRASAHACNTSTWDAEEGGLWVWDKPGSCSKSLWKKRKREIVKYKKKTKSQELKAKPDTLKVPILK